MYAAVDDPERYAVHEILFHRAVAKATGNNILSALLEATTPADLQGRPAPHSQQDLRVWADLHHEIYLAIRARKSSKARMLMEKYLSAMIRETPYEAYPPAQAKQESVTGIVRRGSDGSREDETDPGRELDRLAS